MRVGGVGVRVSVRVRVVQLHLLLVAIEEVEPEVRGGRHEGRLARARVRGSG